MNYYLNYFKINKFTKIIIFLIKKKRYMFADKIIFCQHLFLRRKYVPVFLSSLSTPYQIIGFLIIVEIYVSQSLRK